MNREEMDAIRERAEKARENVRGREEWPKRWWEKLGVATTSPRDRYERESLLAWMRVYAEDVPYLLERLEEKERACRERFALDEAIRRTRMAYPENVFPPNGESVDAKSAAWARMVCDNIRSTAQDILEEPEEQP
jgi:hypothetical protein